MTDARRLSDSTARKPVLLSSSLRAGRALPWASLPAAAAAASSADPFADDEEEEEGQQQNQSTMAAAPLSSSRRASSTLRRSSSASPPVGSPPSRAAAAAAAAALLSPPPVTPARSGHSSTARHAASSAPAAGAQTGQAHLASLLQRMGKSLPRSAGRWPASLSATASPPPPPSHASTTAAASAFDALLRESSARASASARDEYIAQLARGVVAAEREKQEAAAVAAAAAPPPTTRLTRRRSDLQESSWFARQEADDAQEVETMEQDDDVDVTRQEAQPGEEADAPQSMNGLRGTFVRSSPKRRPVSATASPSPPPVSLSATAAAAMTMDRPFLPRALSSSFAEASAKAAAAATANSKPGLARSSSMRPSFSAAPSRSSSSRSSPLSHGGSPWKPAGGRTLLSCLSVRMEDIADDDANANEANLLGGTESTAPLDEGATQELDEEEEDDGCEGFSFAKDGAVARELALQAAAAEQARIKAATRKREQQEKVRLERNALKRKREAEAKANAASDAAAGDTHQLPAAKKPSPLKSGPPNKRPAQSSFAPATADPFDDSWESSPQIAAPPEPSPPPVASLQLSSRPSSAATKGGSTTGSSSRSSSSSRGSGGPAAPRPLPAQLAVCVGSTILPPMQLKKPSPPPPSGSPGTLARTVSSELLAMRRKNLAQKSHSALLLEALLGKSSAELKAVHDVALTPAQKVMMLQRAPSTSSSAAASTTAPVTFASVLHKQTGRRLKAKQGEGVGGNAKQRNRARRIDGFIGDSTPLLERTVEYLLAQGADPNIVDADRNNALWIALQLKGSERVVKMLLEKGAEMVEALESEDESDDEATAEEGKDSSSGDRPAARLPSAAALQAYRPPQIASSVRAMRKTAGAHPSLPQTLRDLQNASDGAGDLFNFERGSTVDLAMKLGCERHALLLLKAGHLPHRNGRVRLLDFARLHGFSQFATEFLTRHLWEAVRDADETKVLDMVRHMDRKLVDHPDHTGRSPLYAAVESKDPSLTIVEALLKAGASPNHTDISATPMAVFPLCRAAAKSTSVLALLIRYGLNPRLEVSDSGQTLLEFAHEAGSRAESIALLQEAERVRSDKWQQQQQARAQQTETAAAARPQPSFNNHGH